MPKKIDVYGLTDTDLKALRQIALQRYGKSSVSLLLKNLALAELQKPKPTLTANIENKKKRITLMLPENERQYLQDMAELNRSSLSAMIREIIRQHSYKNRKE